VRPPRRPPTDGGARRVLGLSAFHADASAAALAGGNLVAAVEEERFRRVKHWAGFPREALAFCLAELGCDLGAVEAVAVSRQPRAYLLRKAALALSHPRSLWRAASRARNLAQVAALAPRLAAELGAARVPRLHPVEHHLAHLASAFFCSPFDEAACLSVDGFGDFVSTMLAAGRGTAIEVLERVHFPHSLGQLYTAVTQYLGFPDFGDEYKVMGLAAYGEPSFAAALGTIVPALPDGTFRLDLGYFRHLAEGVDMTWDDGAPRLGPLYTPALERLLGPARRPGEELTQRHKDVAASLQRVYEERFFALVRAVVRRTGLKRLALAGGCAMNSLANGKLFERAGIDEVYIQAAAGDAGTALGAALWVHHAVLGAPRELVMEHCYWGPGYGEAEARRALAAALPACGGRDGDCGEVRIASTADPARLAADTATALARGEVVGWYQGRAEWGPRALGNRSILADPRRGDMKELLNRKIKRRESFRPFAPSVLEERTGDWFTLAYPDPFMIKVYPIRPEKRPLIPAVTHADGTGRLQTVSRRANPLFWQLIRAFEQATGVPMVLNTSFNENEPIVNTPAEALDCFLRTRMDRLVLGSITLTRQPSAARAAGDAASDAAARAAGAGAAAAASVASRGGPAGT
jgi:carbamoyltransferase